MLHAYTRIRTSAVLYACACMVRVRANLCTFDAHTYYAWIDARTPPPRAQAINPRLDRSELMASRLHVRSERACARFQSSGHGLVPPRNCRKYKSMRRCGTITSKQHRRASCNNNRDLTARSHTIRLLSETSKESTIDVQHGHSPQHGPLRSLHHLRRCCPCRARGCA